MLNYYIDARADGLKAALPFFVFREKELFGDGVQMTGGGWLARITRYTYALYLLFLFYDLLFMQEFQYDRKRLGRCFKICESDYIFTIETFHF